MENKNYKFVYGSYFLENSLLFFSPKVEGIFLITYFEGYAESDNDFTEDPKHYTLPCKLCYEHENNNMG